MKSLPPAKVISFSAPDGEKAVRLDALNHAKRNLPRAVTVSSVDAATRRIGSHYGYFPFFGHFAINSVGDGQL